MHFTSVQPPPLSSFVPKASLFKETKLSRKLESMIETTQAQIPHYTITHLDQFSQLSVASYRLFLRQDC